MNLFLKGLSLFGLLLVISCTVKSPDFTLSYKLYDNYEQYKEEQIQQRRFTIEDIEPLILRLNSDPAFDVKQAATSIEGRPIYLTKLGNGPTKILFWSQMHGNESTGTMALLDIFNFFLDENAEFAELKANLMDKLTIYIIPMLNPDGANRFERRNSIGIDINRDALRLTSPESKLLKELQETLKPEFAMHLHDESIFNTPERGDKPATISVLAPVYDFEKSENAVRKRSMQVMTEIFATLEQFIPNGVARYPDDHEPRAFGDMFQKWGSSMMLIESGGYPGDTEKQYIRKLNFVAILSGLNSIAEQNYTGIPVDTYHDIPVNHRRMSDLIVRNVLVEKEGNKYLVDMAICRNERNVKDTLLFYTYSSICEIGDLSTMVGYEEIDANGWTALPGKVYSKSFRDVQDTEGAAFEELLSEGYTDIVVSRLPEGGYLEDMILNIRPSADSENSVSLGAPANFVLSKDGKNIYTIVNGFVLNPEDIDQTAVRNVIVYR